MSASAPVAPGSDEPNSQFESRLAQIYSEHGEPVSDEKWSTLIGTRAAEMYSVQAGDTLWDLSRTLFADGFYWSRLWAENPEIQNPHQISKGQAIRFVGGTEAAPPEIRVVQDQPDPLIEQSNAAFDREDEVQAIQDLPPPEEKPDIDIELPPTRAKKAESKQMVGQARKRLDFEAELERTFAPNDLENERTLTFKAEPVPSVDNTIAVLPFVNMSPGNDEDYFSDGLAEELLNVLSKINGLRVAARTSAFSFKGKQTTISEIGRALNVGSVLEGSIRTSGDRVRISVQLVKVADGYQIWSETYDRKMDDIFAVQDDIAGSVVGELRSMRLGESTSTRSSSGVRSEVKEAVKGRSASPEAQRLMLLGRHYLDRTTPDDTTQAIDCFRQAVEIDPSYALCWAEMGLAFSIEAGRAWVPVGEGFDRSREATEKGPENRH